MRRSEYDRTSLSRVGETRNLSRYPADPVEPPDGAWPDDPPAVVVAQVKADVDVLSRAAFTPWPPRGTRAA